MYRRISDYINLNTLFFTTPNGSETDIRDFVKKRKVSGGTRSDLGRQCRDTFASLKKTCRKLWAYLQDRVCLTGAIAPLPMLIRNAVASRALP
jgi:hypothetical protein